VFKSSDGLIVHTRADWNARVPTMPYARQPFIHSVVYHHGGPEGPPRFTDQAMASTLRSWQTFHQGPERQWSDIGYHWLMDGRGELWQGRPAWAVGAHVLQQNTGRLGLCFVQDGRVHGLTPGQEKTLRRLFRVKHTRLGLPAFKELVRNPGASFGVFAHRDVPGQSTECPGTELAADVKKIIKEWA
jgi:hypothetical protein